MAKQMINSPTVDVNQWGSLLMMDINPSSHTKKVELAISDVGNLEIGTHSGAVRLVPFKKVASEILPRAHDKVFRTNVDVPPPRLLPLVSPEPLVTNAVVVTTQLPKNRTVSVMVSVDSKHIISERRTENGQPHSFSKNLPAFVHMRKMAL